jgi:predicted amino acid racemase
MRVKYPCIEVDLSKITHNTKEILSICNPKGIDITVVTKGFCAESPVVEAMIQGGIAQIGDSRIQNLIKLKGINCKKTLLRLPMLSEVEDVVKYSNFSLNSEIETIKALSKAAKAQDKIHDIILMVDIGDLREGLLIKDVIPAVKEIIDIENINLIGLGTNVTCYGGVIPERDNLGELISLKRKIKQTFNLEIPVISGGNSSSLYLVMDNNIPEGINNLRIGEAIILGRESSYGNPVPNCYNDAFILKAEIIEVKEKPTVPTGKIGYDAFWQIPHFDDKGIRKRAIAAIGRQDIKLDGMFPLDKKISVFGASSDHLILDVTECDKTVKVGDVVEFRMDYGCLLASSTSSYVTKYYKK